MGGVITALSLIPGYLPVGISLTNDESLTYWKFGELIKNLIALSEDADIQLLLSGECVATEELIEDFNRYYTLSQNDFLRYGLLNSTSKERLKDLKSAIEN